MKSAAAEIYFILQCCCLVCFILCRSFEGSFGLELCEIVHVRVATVCSEFEVDSLNFPGQVHRWRLTQLLQKGTVRAQDSLLNVRSLH